MGSIIFTASTGFFTIYMPGILSVLGIAGGLGCVAVAYVVPLMGYLFTHPENKKTRALYIAIGAVLVFIGFCSFANSVMQLIEENSKPK